MHKQKPTEIDIFIDEEEKDVKERVEKRKKQRQEVAEKNKALERKKIWKRKSRRGWAMVAAVKNSKK